METWVSTLARGLACKLSLRDQWHMSLQEAARPASEERASSGLPPLAPASSRLHDTIVLIQQLDTASCAGEDLHAGRRPDTQQVGGSGGPD